MEAHSEQAARRVADAFVENQPAQEQYELEFESIAAHGHEYQIRYRKVFREPTKENPPYRLVIVDASGQAHWGNP
jgi:hypothetical protein